MGEIHSAIYLEQARKINVGDSWFSKDMGWIIFAQQYDGFVIKHDNISSSNE
jgi:hypothetical protein